MVPALQRMLNFRLAFTSHHFFLKKKVVYRRHCPVALLRDLVQVLVRDPDEVLVELPVLGLAQDLIAVRVNDLQKIISKLTTSNNFPPKKS